MAQTDEESRAAVGRRSERTMKKYRKHRQRESAVGCQSPVLRYFKCSAGRRAQIDLANAFCRNLEMAYRV